MRKGSTIFLQVVIVFIGIGSVGLLLWEPHIEGRNAHATVFQIYFNDPFWLRVHRMPLHFSLHSTRHSSFWDM